MQATLLPWQTGIRVWQTGIYAAQMTISAVQMSVRGWQPGAKPRRSSVGNGKLAAREWRGYERAIRDFV